MTQHTEPQPAATSASVSDTVLVDTSLLIEQQKRHKYAQPVRRALEAYRFRGASSYSKLEFKRAWLQRLAFIYTISLRPDVKTITDLIDYFNRKLASHPLQQRRLQSCLDMLLAFFDLGSCQVSHSTQLVRLRAHCRRSILDSSQVLNDLVTAYFRNTHCSRAEEPPRELAGGFLDVSIPKCKPSAHPCQLAEFFTANQSLFASLADYIDTQQLCSDELKTMRDHIRQALKAPTHLCTDGNCSKIADAIIAVDGKDMDTFAANNNAEWRHIAAAFRKPLLNPVVSPYPQI